ncbi:MAG: phosphoribosylanthranilate isomerase [Clostridiaceae bacterium]|jgi:phosphoribosylanthranilate isomerase|nr:phosphoribosylanthranilate isomerase [Clostridiaceae bacterium]
MKIKICGLFRPEDIEYANAAAPDYVGFVFAETSRRRVSPHEAEILRAGLKDGIEPVGIFVNADVADIEALYLKGVINVAQLHGGEDGAYINELKSRCGISVIKAVRTESTQDIERAAKLPADFLLLDNGGGGTGRRFDWSLIRDVDKPYFLAGGINLSNVRDACLVGPAPFAIDVSGGAETDGVKDAAKIAALVRIVRDCR